MNEYANESSTSLSNKIRGNITILGTYENAPDRYSLVKLKGVYD